MASLLPSSSLDSEKRSFSSGHDGERGPANGPKVDAESSDGGWRGWSVLLGVWLVQFCTFGYTNAFGVYNDFYVRTYLNGSSSSQISWIGSIQLFLLSFAGLITGRAYDTGYFYHMMIGGSLLFVFCLFMLSFAQPGQYYQIFLTQGLGLGLATGICYIPSLALVSQYFYRQRALAMGIAASAAAVGGTLHPIMLNRLFYGPVGFQNGVRASAGLCGCLLLLGLILMRQRLPPAKHDFDMLRTTKTFATDVPFLFMTLGATFIYAGLYFPIFFVQLNAMKNGISPQLAFYSVAILNASSVVGRIAPTMFVRRLGTFNVTIGCLWVVVILIFCTLAIKNVAATIIYAIMYGFFSGTYCGLLAPLVASTVDDDSELGARLGVCYFIAAFGGLVGNPIAGALLTSSFVWWRPLLFAGLCVFAGNSCFLAARHVYSKKKCTQWL